MHAITMRRSANPGFRPFDRDIIKQITTNVPKPAKSQNDIGAFSGFRKEPKTAVNNGNIAAIVAAWLAGTLCSATVVKIGKMKTMPTAAMNNRRICFELGNE